MAKQTSSRHDFDLLGIPWGIKHCTSFGYRVFTANLPDFQRRALEDFRAQGLISDGKKKSGLRPARQQGLNAQEEDGEDVGVATGWQKNGQAVALINIWNL